MHQSRMEPWAGRDTGLWLLIQFHASASEPTDLLIGEEEVRGCYCHADGAREFAFAGWQGGADLQTLKVKGRGLS